MTKKLLKAIERVKVGHEADVRTLVAERCCDSGEQRKVNQETKNREA
jgi:hypothetical protein